MKIWEIDGFDYNVLLSIGKYMRLPTLRVVANSFDEAISLARQVHPDYSGGHLYTAAEVDRYIGPLLVAKHSVVEGGTNAQIL